MQREPMSHQAQRVQELLHQGLSRRQIAEELGVSSPRITQIIGNTRSYSATTADRARWRRGSTPYRQDLIRLRHATNDLAKLIRRDLRELHEELEAYEVDRVLGLRAG